MNTREVTRLLNRFKKDDFHIVLKNWSIHVSDPNFTSDTCSKMIEESTGPSGKKKFVQGVLKGLRKKTVTDEDVAELDLLCTVTYSTCKSWSVHKVQRASSAGTSPLFRSPLQLQQQLLKQLRKFQLRSIVKVTFKDEAFWAVVCIADDRRGTFSLQKAVYFVHRPETEFVCFSNLKTSHKSFICQAMIGILKGSSIEALDLEGKCVKSLMQIVLNLRTQELPRRPVSSDNQYPKSRKRKAPDSDSSEADDRIYQENWCEKRRRQEFILNRFGDEPQPVLEHVTYTLETNFRGGAHAPDVPGDSIIRCQVKLSGPSVLEGIKSLASAGFTDIPMKDHLCRIRTLARNKFRFVPKRAATNENG